jgi:hypothetical protein
MSEEHEVNVAITQANAIRIKQGGNYIVAIRIDNDKAKMAQNDLMAFASSIEWALRKFGADDVAVVVMDGCDVQLYEVVNDRLVDTGYVPVDNSSYPFSNFVSKDGTP